MRLPIRVLKILLFLLFYNSFLQAQFITTVAGTGVAGNSGDNGPAIAARLNVPAGIVFDLQGNLLIADQDNYVIRKLNVQTGIITRIAGTGVGGHQGDGGPALNAQLYGPSGIAIDKAGNIYIAEQYNSTIRKIDAATGIITTICGIADYNTNYSGDGGPAVLARLDRPTDVDVDIDGNVYIADWDNNVVRKINANTGIITTVAGRYPGSTGYSGDGGPATNALLNQCSRIYIDPAKNILIGDQLNNVVRRVNAATGIINTIAGTGAAGYSGNGGPALQAQMNKPSGITLDAAGNLYIADSYNQMIHRVDAVTGVITTIAGNGNQGYSGDGGPALNASFYRPTDLAFDANGDLYIADARNSVIRKISLCPTVSLGNDKTICKGSSLQLDAGSNFNRFEWNTGAATQTLQINSPGTYWVKASINTCTVKDTIVVTEYPDVQFNWPNDTTICPGTPLIINAPAGTTVQQWQDGTTTASYAITDTGKYWVTVTDQHNCINSDTLLIDKTFTPPSNFLEKEITYCWYDSVLLKSQFSFSGYLWSNGSTNASITVGQEGVYWLQVMDQHHCIGIDTIAVKANPDCKLGIHFYNAFTPNNDNKNDVFKPVVEGALVYYHMIIYNRWGQKVFETNDWHNGWSGNFNNYPQPAGMYVYNITYQLPRSARKNQKGTVLLMR
jgi:gliding motility-associated-like protein